MNKIYMYAHGGSGNHGCEAIVRSTIKMLKQISNEKAILISSKPEEDEKYDIDKICKILKDKYSYSKLSLDFIKAYFSLKVKKDYIPMDKLSYKKTIKNVSKDDIAMSIGGDNYCYKDVEKYIMLHDMFLEQGAKTVLWGCSIEPNLVDIPKINKDLKRYSLITARETISYEALKKVNPNTVLVADPAFNLDTEEIYLPDSLIGKDIVGINVSPMIMENEKICGITMENYERLIQHILQETDMSVMLVPHVVWDKNDDRIPLKKLNEKFKESGRVMLVEDNTCEKIKGYISKCRFFIGARTHSTIAAYSSCIPTLVVGYSVKAKGIAKDLFGTEDNYVLSVQNIKEKDELCKAFEYIYKHELEIKKKLESNMQSVKICSQNGVNALSKYMSNK